MILRELGENETDRKQWDDYVLSSAFGHLFQTYSWGELARSLGWCPRRYWVSQGGRVSAAAQVLVRKKGPFSILYVPRGPIFSDRESFDFLINELRKLVRGGKAFFCKINPCCVQSPEIQAAYRENGLVRSPTREMHICTFRIDLTVSLDSIWNNFRGSVRTRIRKAEKSGIETDASETLENLRGFYEVYRTLSETHKASTHSYDFVRRVWEVFSPSKGVRVFTAKLSGKPVAAEFVFLHKKTGELMWVASKRLENDLGAGQLLHWAIIRWLKENGFASYDLGGVPPSRETLPGIYFHKESLGGEHIELAGEYEIEHGGWRTLFWNFCARIRGKIK